MTPIYRSSAGLEASLLRQRRLPGGFSTIQHQPTVIAILLATRIHLERTCAYYPHYIEQRISSCWHALLALAFAHTLDIAFAQIVLPNNRLLAVIEFLVHLES